MDLSGATIRGAGASALVLEGDLSCVFRDRRQPPDGKPLVGPAARRRRLPSGLAEMVGGGKLWVAQGYFSLSASDVAKWGKSSDMRMTLEGIELHITLLKPQASNGPDEKTWVFYALFTPTPEQLEALPVIDFNPGLAANARDPLVDYLTALLDADPSEFVSLGELPSYLEPTAGK
jgi:hypothetical protein